MNFVKLHKNIWCVCERKNETGSSWGHDIKNEILLVSQLLTTKKAECTASYIRIQWGMDSSGPIYWLEKSRGERESHGLHRKS